MKINIKTDIRWAFFYFFVVVLLGVFLRSVFVVSYPFNFNYRYVLHAHSHTAFLGWIYVLLTAFVRREFIPKDREKKYRILFYFTQFSILGMLFSFPFQGYAGFSIAFATLFVILSYIYAYFFIKDTKKYNKDNDISYLFVKYGIFYLVLSSLGIWAIPISVVKFGKNSDFYNASISFFLHFQYNGWILTTLMGLIIRKLGLSFSNQSKLFFYAFQMVVVGTVVISWLGVFDEKVLKVISFCFVSLWFILLLKITKKYAKLSEKHLLSTLFFSFFILKILVMWVGVVWSFYQSIFSNQDLFISYLHLNFLGIINCGLFFLLEKCRILKINRIFLYIYLLAFVLSELLIAYKGLSIFFNFPFLENYFLYLFIISFLFIIPAGWWFFRVLIIL